MQLTCVSRTLHPRRPFRISRARRTEVRNVFVRIEAEGVAGFGEASPNAFYGETWEIVAAKLESARDWLAGLAPQTVSDVEAAWRDGWSHLAPSRAAQCALDLALWDWLARRNGVSVSALAWNAAPKPVISFATIGLSTPEELAEKLAELCGYPRIKIKSDEAADLAPIRAARSRTDALLAVDANCAWATVDLPAVAGELQTLGVDFLEQPYPPERDFALPPLPLPLMADESCVTEEDVGRLTPAYAGYNIKLVKCGGITPARRMIAAGRAHGRKLMVGCMLESSALIAAGAAVAQRTDYADLDGAWLIADDPFSGWLWNKGVIEPPSGHCGLGITPNPDLFEPR